MTSLATAKDDVLSLKAWAQKLTSSINLHATAGSHTVAVHACRRLLVSMTDPLSLASGPPSLPPSPPSALTAAS